MKQPVYVFLSSPPVRDFVRTTNRPVEDVLSRGRFDGIRSELMFGGPAFFVLDELAALGVHREVVPSFPVGTDEHSDDFLQVLSLKNIRTDAITKYAGRLRYNVVVEFTNDRRVIQDEFRPQLRIEHFHIELIQEATQLLISGSLPLDLIREAISEAKNANVPFCWNPYPLHFDLIDEIAPGAAMIQVNVEEAIEVLGTAKARKERRAAFSESTGGSMDAEAKQMVKSLHDRTLANTVVVTRGSAGAYAMGPDGELVCVDPPRRCSNQRHTGMGDRHFAVLSIMLKRHDYDLRMALGKTVEHFSE